MTGITLSLSQGLYLTFAPFTRGPGKTADMAKGPFIGLSNTVYAGESSGFGVPVLKTPGRTFFPQIADFKRIAPDAMEVVYRLNLFLGWRMMGWEGPSVFNDLAEILASLYMKHPEHQQRLLGLRNRLFRVLRIRTYMRPGITRGFCRVVYGVGGGRLAIGVDGRELNPNSRLILLNEAEGSAFSRLRDQGRSYEGENVPAWAPCSLDAVVENPADGIGFSLSAPPGQSASQWKVNGGREVGRGLNWAGLALTPGRRRFSYWVAFFTAVQKNICC